MKCLHSISLCTHEFGSLLNSLVAPLALKRNCKEQSYFFMIHFDFSTMLFGLFKKIKKKVSKTSLWHCSWSWSLVSSSFDFKSATKEIWKHGEKWEIVYTCEHRLHTFSCRNESIPFFYQRDATTTKTAFLSFSFSFSFCLPLLRFGITKNFIIFLLLASIDIPKLQVPGKRFAFFKWLWGSEMEECNDGIAQSRVRWKRTRINEKLKSLKAFRSVW